MPDPIGIKRYSIPELRALLASWGEPTFRATQLLRWLYADGASSYQDMSNLSKSLRRRLEEDEPLYLPEIVDRQVSADRARKYVLRLADGLCVETVGIPDRERLTVCFSTQVGCSMGCLFCTTGSGGLSRSLYAGEMVDQLTIVSGDMGLRVTNAVAMGEGEPFANYDATLAALRIMNSPDGPGIGARHLTVSTCGLIKQVDRFAQEPEQFTLAVSLHSAVQSTRDMLMPALANQPLDALRQSLVRYTEKTGRRLSFEVVLIDTVNDTPHEIAAMLEFAQGLLCHINLIPLNRMIEACPDAAAPLDETDKRSPALRSAPYAHGVMRRPVSRATRGFELVPSSYERVSEIAAAIQRTGLECSIRRSRGLDIQGACGQLKGMRS